MRYGAARGRIPLIRLIDRTACSVLLLTLTVCGQLTNPLSPLIISMLTFTRLRQPVTTSLIGLVLVTVIRMSRPIVGRTLGRRTVTLAFYDLDKTLPCV